MVTRLIMFSGGVDSTFRLVHALRETDDTVLAHHINLHNRDKRGDAERIACRRIVQHCKTHYRDFRYTESTIERPDFIALNFDIMTAAAEIGPVVADYHFRTGKTIEIIAFGTCQEDVGNPTTSDDSPRLYDNAIEAVCFPLPPPQRFNKIVWPKHEYLAYLGKTVASMCWTCRTPKRAEQGFEECGTCHTCEEMKVARATWDEKRRARLNGSA